MMFRWLHHARINPIIRLAERARTKKLKPEEFQGDAFTVSNLGMFGVKTIASIINEHGAAS